MLHADSILKSYGTNQVLTDVYITCKTGEILGLVGRNGSGKSTLLKTIFGTLNADYKFVRINNKQIRTLSDAQSLIKYLPQDNYLPKNITISKIMQLYQDFIDLEEFRNSNLIADILDLRSNQLSGGQKRLVEILLVLYSKAEYLLLDEPFNGVAPIYKDEIKRLIKSKSADKGIIITDHDYRNVLDVSSRIVLIYDGGTREVKDHKELEYWGYLPDSE